MIMRARWLWAAVLGALAALYLAVVPSIAQNAPASMKLLDHLAGRWVMTGRLGTKAIKHDVNVQWILNREYIQFHEISRDKAANGVPVYEAIVYINKNAHTNQYTCLWLDSTAAAPEFQPIGHAVQVGNSLPFIITVSAQDAIHTTFSYDASKGRWHLTIDDVNQGKTSRFGDVQLIRKS